MEGESDIYVCSRCTLTFKTGQSLGGHMRWNCRPPTVEAPYEVIEDNVEGFNIDMDIQPDEMLVVEVKCMSYLIKCMCISKKRMYICVLKICMFVTKICI